MAPSPEGFTTDGAASSFLMSVRRAHTKSRNGCSDCKRRKVKCDETYPSCHHCTRRGIACSLSASGSVARGPCNEPRAAASDRSVGSTKTPEPGSGTPQPFAVANLDTLCHGWRPSPPISDTWGHGLELMHQYSTMTANTLAIRPDLQHLWRTGVPELAYDSPFLMQIILATAAAHKAYLLPAQRDKYINLAVYHQTAGLEGFRSALTNLEAHDWRSVFCFASMVVFSINWSPKRPETNGIHAGGTPQDLDCFVFIRGVRALLAELEPQLDGTFLAPMAKGVYVIDAEWSKDFEQTLSSRHSALPPGQAEALEAISKFYDDCLSGERLAEYQLAVVEMKRSAYCIAKCGPQPEVGVGMVPAYLIADNVMRDMLALDPYAIILLAQFCVFFRLLETRFWFISGLSKRVFKLIDAHLAGLPTHLDVVKWARKQVFEFYEPI